jgi:fatty-acyl-CoA synthase
VSKIAASATAERSDARPSISPAAVVPPLWRAGLLAPDLVGALTGAALWWGPTVAASYSAAALRHPLRTALVDDHGRLTYIQLATRTDRVAAALRSRGLGAGAPIGVLCRNHRGFVEATIALAKIGARPIYLNTGLAPGQLASVVNRERLESVVCDREFVAAMTDVAPHVELVVAAPEDDAGWSFPDLARRKILLRMPSPGTASDPVILTSGTTGVPKGAQRSAHGSMLPALAGLLAAMPLRRGDRILVAAPLFHAWGLGQMTLTASLAGTLVLRRRFDPRRVLDDARQHQVDVVAVVPTMLVRMLDVDGAQPLTHVRVVASSGGPLVGDIATAWMDVHGDTLYNLYGSTEVGQVAIAGPDDLRRAPGCAGVAPLGVELRIVDDAGADVDPGSIGRIVVRSGSHFDGYTGGGTKPIIDGFMDIGDTGYTDRHGLLHVVGRSDDMIVTGGENVYPQPIEDVLVRHVDVVDAAIVGVPDDDLGQRIVAHVVRRPGSRVTAATLRAHCRANLAAHEVPRSIEFCNELPRNATGKVLRGDLSAGAR